MKPLALALLCALFAGGCGGGDGRPPKGERVAKQLLGVELVDGFGKATTGYCRRDYAGAYNCVMRTPKGRVSCSVSLESDDHVEGTYCTPLRGS